MAYNIVTPKVRTTSGMNEDYFTSSGSMPKEWTPELTKGFYESMARPIEERTRADVGRVRGEALRRGLEGDPFESLGVSKVRSEGANQLADLWSGISMEGAGLARQERLTGEGRAYESAEAEKQRTWQSEENKRLREFQDAMAARREEAMRQANRRSTNWWEIGGTALGLGAGLLVPGGGLAAGQLGAQLGGGLGRELSY